MLRAERAIGSRSLGRFRCGLEGGGNRIGLNASQRPDGHSENILTSSWGKAGPRLEASARIALDPGRGSAWSLALKPHSDQAQPAL